MKHIKTGISVLLLAALLLSLSSCGLLGLIYIPAHDEEAFADLLPKLFEALDNRDEAAIYDLFSNATKEKCADLQEKITTLVATYSGPTDEYDFDSIMFHTEEYIGGSGNTGKTMATFPIRSGEDYYYFYIALMYEHYDEAQIGIVQLDFYTLDEKYAHHGEWREDRAGLYIYAETELDYEVRVIDSTTYRYTPKNRTIDIGEVERFLQMSNSRAAFVKHFGEPNAEDIYFCYELPSENGEPRYLLLGDDFDGMIYSATIVDDFDFIKLIWEDKE